MIQALPVWGRYVGFPTSGLVTQNRDYFRGVAGPQKHASSITFLLRGLRLVSPFADGRRNQSEEYV